MKKHLKSILRHAKNNAFVAGVRNKLNQLKWRKATHDDVYDAEYFDFVDKTTGHAASIITKSIVTAFSPVSIIDVGCGTGVLLERFREIGVRVQGVEFAKAAMEHCMRRGLDVEHIDLRDASQMVPPHSRFDVVMSMEVGHQMPPACAAPYIEYLCRLGDTVVFSSESPQYVDRLSLNSQYKQYWIDLFSDNNFLLDSKVTNDLQNEWKSSGLASWFWRNILVFHSK